MAKSTPQFKAYDLRRKFTHSIPHPPAKITQHRLDRSEWAASAAPKGISKKKAGKKHRKRTPRSVAEILRYGEDEMCLCCGRYGDGAECNAACYKALQKSFLASQIEIRGPDRKTGYGAYVKPGGSIKKGAYLDEDIGLLRPLTAPYESMYRLEIPGTAAVDAEKAGNWTRFVNSSCEPNLKPWGEFVGKRKVVLFQAMRDIGEGEEITFNYESNYFEKAGFPCACGAFEQPHMPGEGRKREVSCARRRKR